MMFMDVHFVFIIKTKTVVTFEGRVRPMIDPQYNKDATSRPTDNILIPQVRPVSQIP